MDYNQWKMLRFLAGIVWIGGESSVDGNFYSNHGSNIAIEL